MSVHLLSGGFEKISKVVRILERMGSLLRGIEKVSGGIASAIIACSLKFAKQRFSSMS